MSRTIDKIEIPDEMLREAMRRARTEEPKAAVLEALRDFVRPRSQADLIQYLGKSDGFFTPEELEKMRDIDS